MDATTPLLEGGRVRHGGCSPRRWVGGVVMSVGALAMVVVFLGGSNTWLHSPLDVACRATFYPETCKATLVGMHRASPEELTGSLVSNAALGVRKTLATVVGNGGGGEVGLSSGERVCHQTLESSIEQLETSLATLTSVGSDVSRYPFDDLKTLLSAAMEFHTTCIDTLMETGALDQHTVDQKQHTEELLSNALAIVNALSRFGTDVRTWERTTSVDGAPDPNSDCVKNSRRFLNRESATDGLLEEETGAFPSWMSSEQQALLIEADPPVDVVVAKDGSGKFKTIQAAIDAAPKSGKTSAKRYVIRIKAGVYDEQVTVPKQATNFMFIGDGAAKSTITGDRSVAKTPGMTTFLSASLIIEGAGFIGKAFAARNTAGAEGHQAVAMRVSADMAAFYLCAFDSWQDTLYTHTFRQYYRECTILGTIDFIFGNGAVAFQSCAIIAKKSPLLGQQNTYTAQGKTDQGQATGLSFQSCIFDATPELKANTGNFKTYLGRPWKTYSTHVNLKCNLMGHIDAAGWLPWNTSDFGLKTSFFAEWQDFGPGAANLGKRVWWSKQITDKNVAMKYQALPFTQANQWVPATGIPLTTSLP
ncbi:hypothetical protein KC19_7G130700 [Ceratodon purpureus]|uniref:Pectinesterase n=1 Tax=Ceratodon purpureus TaxID=3225 RepID=A0A8T0H9L7_CERPU|nr:hypothetical protein KC19_7G130700 [Ceratodon purpureus]